MNTDLMFSSKDQTWETPQDLFDNLNNMFHFDIDVCALPETAKCKKYFTPETDGLKQAWSGVCWMNPPYNDAGTWIEKAYKESKKGAIVVCLIPCRPDTNYWTKYCTRAEQIWNIKGRLKFGNSKNAAPFPSAIIIFNGKHKTPEYYIYYKGSVVKYIVDVKHIKHKKKRKNKVRKIRVTRL